ncbi:MAG: hypothetical protein AAF805_07885 [Planctomycetota bacterium]
MDRAIVRKELRESAAIVAVGLLFAGWMLLNLTGAMLGPRFRPSNIPFLSGQVTSLVLWVGAGVAIALGLKQTAWEKHNDTFRFLLHRPIARERLLAVKLLVGWLLTLLVTGSAVLVYALWAATPGSVDAPFRWSMTLPAWGQVASLSIVYLGAFASGIGPGRWFGTRLAPLVASAIAAMSANAAPQPWLGWLLGVAAAAALLTAIWLHARTRDF